MKHSYLPVLAGGVLTATALGAAAQVGTPDFDPLGEFHDLPKMIRVQNEFIEMSHETLTSLMSDDEITTDGQLRARLTDLIKKKEATILETMIVVARPGQKATAESIEEFIYPTEYEPAELPRKLRVRTDGKKEASHPSGYATGPTPTAFETRNLGSTLEVEPNIGANGRIIDLRFAPEIVHHVRNQVWAEWQDERGNAHVQMPIMFSMRTSTGVTVAAGEYRMVSVHSPKGEDGFPDFNRKVMLFVKCDLVVTGR